MCWTENGFEINGLRGISLIIRLGKIAWKLTKTCEGRIENRSKQQEESSLTETLIGYILVHKQKSKWETTF